MARRTVATLLFSGALVVGLLAPAATPGAAANTVWPASTGSDSCDFSNQTSVVLDTNVHGSTVYNCTDLKVPAGTTVVTVGRGVLEFRLTGSADIKGTIDVSGATGGCGGGSTGNVGVAAGACPGGGGGDAGTAGADGSGSSGSGGNKGGGGGGIGTTSSVINAGGGGGGVAGGAGGGGFGGPGGGPNGGTASGGRGGSPAWATAAVSGVLAATTNNGDGGGGGGIGSDADLFQFSTFRTGSGGGGGEAGLAPGASRPGGTGGGGGGGGGALKIVSPSSIILDGQLRANGGNGGAGQQNGGGGGGGSGGAVFLAAPIVAFGASSVVSARGGVGGTAAPGAGAGGSGSSGRIRLAADTVTGTQTFTTGDPQGDGIARTPYTSRVEVTAAFGSVNVTSNGSGLIGVSVNQNDGQPTGANVPFALTSSSPTGVFLDAAATNEVTTVVSGADGTASFRYRDTTAGTAHLTVSSTGVASGTLDLDVRPGPLHHLTLSPASASVAPGIGQAYTAVAKDQYENVRPEGDVTGSTGFAIADGTCTLNSCKATTPGNHTVTGTYNAVTGTATLTVGSSLPAPKAVSITDTAFSPVAALLTAQGQSVNWTNSGSKLHNVTDKTLLGNARTRLFVSSNLSPSQSFTTAFPWAGTFGYRCTLSAFNASVKVPLTVAPSSGPRTTTFVLTLASGAFPAGGDAYVFEVSVKNPGGTYAAPVQVAGTTYNFDPTAQGTWSFKARLKNTTTGRVSGYSPVKSIRVTT